MAEPVELTEKQRAVLEFLVAHIETEHRWPSLQDIADHFRWSSPNSATLHLDALERKGYITRNRGRMRLARHRVCVHSTDLHVATG